MGFDKRLEMYERVQPPWIKLKGLSVKIQGEADRQKPLVKFFQLRGPCQRSRARQKNDEAK
jgi:hypothetical protein